MEIKAAKGTEIGRESRTLKKSKLTATIVEYDDPDDGKTRFVVEGRSTRRGSSRSWTRSRC